MAQWCVMVKHIKRSHNKSLLLYHLVLPIRYRRKIFTPEVSQSLRDVCLEIAKRYDIHFIEIGTDEDHVHFLLQSIPTYSPQQVTQIIKSITGRELFKTHPEVKKFLWGGKFWSGGYYINTVGQYANEATIRQYVKNQSKQYTELHHDHPTLFPGVV